MKRLVTLCVVLFSIFFLAESAIAQPPQYGKYYNFTFPNGMYSDGGYDFLSMTPTSSDVYLYKQYLHNFTNYIGYSAPIFDLAHWQATHKAILTDLVNTTPGINIPPCGLGLSYTFRVIHPACYNVVYDLISNDFLIHESCNQGTGCEYIYEVCFDRNLNDYVLTLVSQSQGPGMANCVFSYGDIVSFIQANPYVSDSWDCVKIPCR